MGVTYDYCCPRESERMGQRWCQGPGRFHTPDVNTKICISAETGRGSAEERHHPTVRRGQGVKVKDLLRTIENQKIDIL
jgi:hypothetical protein